MKIKKYEGSDLRRVLIGMIVDPIVCSRISSQWIAEGLFDAKWANLVGGLIVRHFRKFGTCPNSQMVGIFESWAAETTADEKTVSAVESFLKALSDEQDQVKDDTSEYVLDLAGKYFDRVRLKQEVDAAVLEMEHGLVEEARNRLGKITKVNLGQGSYIQPISNPDVWLDSTNKERTRALVRYRGDLGKFVGDSFTRGSLYAFMAPDKTGKSTFLIDLMYRSVRARNKVVFFDTGDSNEEEIMERLAMRTTGQPSHDEVVKYPTEWNDKTIKLEDVKLEAVDTMKAYFELKRLAKSEDALRISCHENSSVNVGDLDRILDDWDKEGWRPDVIILDYADILAPERGAGRDSLDQIDQTWKALRRLSQRRHALVLTATQASSNAYNKDENQVLGKADFSGRKTKLAHVNGMLGINVNSKEKDEGTARINWIVRRKGKFNEKHYVKVAGCLSIGNPVILSKW